MGQVVATVYQEEFTVIVYVVANGAMIRDADDCGGFRVESPLDQPNLDVVLRAASVGHGGEHGEAWVSVGWIRSTINAMAPISVAKDWPIRFEAMLDYASSKGWINPTGTYIRAHVLTVPIEVV